MAKGHFVVKQFLLLGALSVLFAPASFGGTSDFGTTGLIKMPDARMEEDGVLRATIAVDEVANIYNVTFQALPKVQATFRYTIFNPTDLRGSRDGLRDRSYEVKTQLLSEADWRPAIALGIRDLLGTGAWEGNILSPVKRSGVLIQR